MPPNKSEPLTLTTIKTWSKAALNRREVAEVLEVDVRTVSYAIERGEIPAIKIGRRVLVPREKFIALFDSPGAA